MQQKCKYCHKPLIDHYIVTGFVGGVSAITDDPKKHDVCKFIDGKIAISDLIKEERN